MYTSECVCIYVCDSSLLPSVQTVQLRSHVKNARQHLFSWLRRVCGFRYWLQVSAHNIRSLIVLLPKSRQTKMNLMFPDQTKSVKSGQNLQSQNRLTKKIVCFKMLDVSSKHTGSVLSGRSIQPIQNSETELI